MLFQLTLAQAPMSLAIVLRFGTRSKKVVPIVDTSEHAQLYFDQFRKQIGTGRMPLAYAD